jgi:hypothetical protein
MPQALLTLAPDITPLLADSADILFAFSISPLRRRYAADAPIFRAAAAASCRFQAAGCRR